MNLLDARVVLRMRGVADVLDLTVPYCVRGWRLFGTLCVLVLGPAFCLCALLHYGAAWTWQQVWVVSVVLGGFLQAPFSLAAGELLFNEPEQAQLRTLIRHLGRRLFPFVFAHITSRMALMVAACTVVGWPIAGSALLFVHEAALLEGASGPGAMARSQKLVTRNNAAAFGMWVALMVCPALCVLLAEVLGQAIVSTTLQLGQPVGDLFTEGGSLYALAGFFMSLPLVATARFLKYIDIRTRKEGWDIQLRFMSVVAAHKSEEHEAA